MPSTPIQTVARTAVGAGGRTARTVRSAGPKRRTDKATGQLTLAALVVFSLFMYRKFTGQTQTSLGHFFIGFFFVFGALAAVSTGAPELAGLFALLIMAGDLLKNGQAVATGVTKSLKSSAPAPVATAASAGAPASSSSSGYTLGGAGYRPASNLGQPPPG